MPDPDDSSQLAEDVRSALDEYASVYREAVRIAADGAPGNEVADLAVACWDGAVALRLVEADEVGFTTGAPPVVGELVRELYESLVVLSGIERVADLLSLPVATCANGETLGPLVRAEGELAGWIAASTRTPLATPDLPRSLVRPDPNDTSPLASYSPARQQLAANADRDLLGEGDRPDLNEVFADRLAEALGVYREAVARARAAGSGDGALDELLAWLTAAARRAAPTLIGFARVADRREGELHLPPASVEGARLLADGFVTLAAAQTSEDLATLPYPDPSEIEAISAT